KVAAEAGAMPGAAARTRAMPARRATRRSDRRPKTMRPECSRPAPRARPVGCPAVDDVRPIGVFDSGVGGLTVLHECLVTMPHEDFLYIGDTGRFPYGGYSLAELRAFASELTAWLEEQGVKLVVVACN